MDHRSRIRERSPRREHDSRDRRDRRNRDSRSRSPSHKRSKTSSSRHERHSTEPSGHHSSSRHNRHREHHASRAPVTLPFDARQLSKGDLGVFRPLFADYLDLQKQKDIEVMDEREVRGRWKSFVGKWNRGELAEGWYDPEMFARITAQNQGASSRASHLTTRRDEREEKANDNVKGRDENSKEEEEEEDDYGPTLPTSDNTRRSGPGIPTLQDLSLRAEQAEEEKQASIADLRALRKADRKTQLERLDELIPRAEPGTRERKLEKRAEVSEKMRSFRDKSPNAVVDERELMGGGDSLEEYKQAKQREQRRKTEREIRREEVERAKREEIEERRRAWREREEGTIGMLKELARQRFG
ncbi:hypothetical protein CEP53_011469 [Fusarium sp. AF-6]|nr:hypothetical protein CEP53_011469 [Fusarium sp. AF-6]